MLPWTKSYLLIRLRRRRTAKKSRVQPKIAVPAEKFCGEGARVLGANCNVLRRWFNLQVALGECCCLKLELGGILKRLGSLTWFEVGFGNYSLENASLDHDGTVA